VETTRRKVAGLGLSALVAVGALTACGSSKSSATSTTKASSDTVAVDVGTGKPVQLKKGALHIAVLMNDTQNQWEQDVANSAKEEGQKFGWTVDIITPGFDVQKQLNQVQTAATNHTYDAIAAVPVDGKLECNAFSKTLPNANVLVSIGAVPLCDKAMNSGDALWQSGTLNWVGGTGVTAQFVTSWLNASAKLNPGAQKAVYVVGPEVLTVTNLQKKIAAEWQSSHPDFKIADFLYTDFTTPDSYKKTLDYLNSHPDTTYVLSSYSPDLTRGVVQALKANGKAGQIKVADSGGSNFSYDALKAGTIQFTTPLFPKETGIYMVDSIKNAQDGKSPQRFVPDIPATLGTPDNIPIITKDNMNIFTPEY
jgi:ABC-type sugar transport system substrate-binding protein